MKISIDTFTGMAPKMAPTLLANSASQEATNVRLISGALTPVNTPKKESNNIVAGATSVFMIGAAGAAVPLSWVADVDVANSPVADTEYRIYYTGDGVPKKTSAALAGTPTGGPTAWYNLGVPGPTAAPTLAATTGSVPAGTYVYGFTYVCQFGAVLLEESAPSPFATVTLGAAGGVALTGIADPPVLTNYNYVYKRIYRSTGTTMQLVAQIALANTTYTDILTPQQILGDALATTGWLPPPSDLKGIDALPSSVLVGFRNNEVWFSEPGFPHAWPVAYMQTFDTPIVGLKTYGNNVVLATQSNPRLGSGVHPDSFTFQKLPMLEPCLSKRSMAGDEFGVLYASSNGLVAVGEDANGLVSGNVLDRNTFANYAPDTFTACVFNRRYYGFYNSVIHGTGGFVFTRSDAASVSDLNLNASAVLIDQKTARMLFVDALDSKLYQFDPVDTLPYTYTWKSKLFQAYSTINMGCFRLRGQEDTLGDSAFSADLAARNAATVAANAAIYAAGGLNSELNGAAINELAGINESALLPLLSYVAKTVGATIWAGKNPILSGNFELNKIYRLPSGFRSLGWEISVTGQREVRGIDLAISPKELGNG